MALLVVQVVLTQAAVTEATRARRLGATASWRGSELVIDRVQPAGWAWDAGIRPMDLVTAINGASLSSATHPSAVEAAETLDVRSPAGQVRRAPAGPATVPVTPLHQASFILLAFALLAIGATVFVVAEEVAPAGALLALSAAAATTLDATLAQPSGAAWAMEITYYGLVGFGGSTLCLFLLFPIKRTSSRWGTPLIWAALGVHALLLISYLWVISIYSVGYELLQKLFFGTLLLDLLVATALLLTSLLTPSARQQTRTSLQLLAVGAVVSFAPFCLLSLIPYLAGFGYLVPADITILSMVLLPASIGSALLSRQFLGATRLVRRGLVALGVWVLLLAAYSIGWSVANSAFPAMSALFSLTEAPVLAVAVIAATFPFAQHWLRRTIERSFFHDMYDYAATLRAISEDLVHISRTEPIARHVLMRLGQTLDLASAQVVLQHGEHQTRFAWKAGPVAALHAVASPEPPGEVAASIPLRVESNEIGQLEVGPKLQDIDLLPEDLQLLETLAPMVATALQNAILLEQLQEQIEILSERESQLAALSSRLMDVHEEERARLALDLHDDPLQRALLLARQLTEANGQLGTASWRQEAEDIVQSLKAICAGLRPPTLEDFGLPAGLDWLLDEVGARSEIAGSLNVSPSNRDSFGRLNPDLELALYRVGQEALTNCVKHSGGSQVTVQLRRTPHDVTLEVQDDGQGYGAPKSSGNQGADSGLHLGIMGMRERLRPWNGSVDIESEPGHGTLVRARVPLAGVRGLAPELKGADGRQN